MLTAMAMAQSLGICLHTLSPKTVGLLDWTATCIASVIVEKRKES